MHDPFLELFLRDLKIQLPYIAVYAIGIVVALYYWRRHPRPSLCVFLACAIKLLVAVGFPAAMVSLRLHGPHDVREEVITIFTVIDACAYVLLFIAVYRWRVVSAREYYLPDDWDRDPEGRYTDLSDRRH